MNRLNQKWTVIVLVTLLVIVSVTSLGAASEKNIKVILSTNNGENPLAYYFKLDDAKLSLLDLMQRYFIVEDDNGFITSIQGKAASNADQTAWMYEINGEMAMIGAAQYQIKDGDVYHWDLRKW